MTGLLKAAVSEITIPSLTSYSFSSDCLAALSSSVSVHDRRASVCRKEGIESTLVGFHPLDSSASRSIVSKREYVSGLGAARYEAVGTP